MLSIKLSNNSKIVVSISGGVDSLGLLFLLKALDRYQLILVHVNHGLRKEVQSRKTLF